MSTALAKGLKAALPVAASYIPIAIAFGVLAKQAGLPFSVVVGMSAMVYAGASQFMAVPMIAAGADPVAIILATGIINIRHAVMSLSLMARLPHLGGLGRSVLAFGITDETFAVAAMSRSAPLSGRFLAALFGTAYAAWIGGTALGAGLSSQIPPQIGQQLSIALYALFLYLLTGAVRESTDRLLPALIGAVVGWAVSAQAGTGWGIVAGTCIGATCGWWAARTQRTQNNKRRFSP
ncbi:MAG: AzlC family ABC transporter permease [Alicyclobacillaceae bacterium]|nr:AzlC family ABC transporter permease [Alicyclobacillaceae bacterium]